MKKLCKDILNILSEDARLTPSKIANIVGKSLDEVKQAIEDMENDGTIVKYAAVINDENVDEEVVEALIELRVTPQITKGFDAMAEDLLDFKQVRDIYLMSGGYDLCVVVKGNSLKEVAMFVSEELSVLENVISTKTHFILKKYKKDGVVIKKAKDNMRLNIQL